jgi:hypothetical protein
MALLPASKFSSRSPLSYRPIAGGFVLPTVSVARLAEVHPLGAAAKTLFHAKVHRAIMRMTPAEHVAKQKLRRLRIIKSEIAAVNSPCAKRVLLRIGWQAELLTPVSAVYTSRV